MVRLSEENAQKVRRKLFRASFSLPISRRQWESLLGTLNFVAEVTPLGRLRLRRLVRVVNRAIHVKPRDMHLPIPEGSLPLLEDWKKSSLVSEWIPWTDHIPNLRVTSDASCVGLGYQSSRGHQNSGVWGEAEKLFHINAKELVISLFLIQENPDVEGEAVCFDMDNATAVHCLSRQGTSLSESLLSLSDQICTLAAARRTHCRLSICQEKKTGGRTPSPASRGLQWNGP